MSITGIKKRVALICNAKGEQIGSKAFKATADTFTFAGSSYNIVTNRAYYNVFKRWYWNVEFYHYIEGNPMPLYYDTSTNEFKPIIDAEVLNAFLNAHVAKEFAEADKKPFLSGINWGIVGIVIVVAIVAYLYMTGVIKH